MCVARDSLTFAGFTTVVCTDMQGIRKGRFPLLPVVPRIYTKNDR